MKLGQMLPPKPCRQWKIAAQLGVKYAVTKAAPELSGMKDPSDFKSLKTVFDSFKDAGLQLYALEGDEFDMSRIKLGKPGRDEDIEKYIAMLRNMGRLGIRLLCYNFMAGVGWFRTRNDTPERGGALSCEFDISQTKKIPPLFPAGQLWENYEYFIRAVIPAAEEANVVMALHPDDPPVPLLMGFPRIFITSQAYRRAMSAADSPAHKITFCQATFKAMGEDVCELVKLFREKIAFLHFRDIDGTAERFKETFHDNGPGNMPELLRTAGAYCPDCLLRPDHTPAMVGEGPGTGYTVLGNIFAIGYIKGILDSIGVTYE